MERNSKLYLNVYSFRQTLPYDVFQKHRRTASAIHKRVKLFTTLLQSWQSQLLTSVVAAVMPCKVRSWFQVLREWTVPGVSVRPEQSVVRLKQASSPWPSCKNQFNIAARQCPACQILSWQEQILHMILAKRPRSDNSGSDSLRRKTQRKWLDDNCWNLWGTIRTTCGTGKRPTWIAKSLSVPYTGESYQKLVIQQSSFSKWHECFHGSCLRLY